jgi:hypothetical protein
LNGGAEQFLWDDNDNENVIARRNDEAISTIADTETASLSLAVTRFVPSYFQRRCYPTKKGPNSKKPFTYVHIDPRNILFTRSENNEKLFQTGGYPVSRRDFRLAGGLRSGPTGPGDRGRNG